MCDFSFIFRIYLPNLQFPRLTKSGEEEGSSGGVPQWSHHSPGIWGSCIFLWCLNLGVGGGEFISLSDSGLVSFSPPHHSLPLTCRCCHAKITWKNGWWEVCRPHLLLLQPGFKVWVSSYYSNISSSFFSSNKTIIFLISLAFFIFIYWEYV